MKSLCSDGERSVKVRICDGMPSSDRKESGTKVVLNEIVAAVPTGGCCEDMLWTTKMVRWVNNLSETMEQNEELRDGTYHACNRRRLRTVGYEVRSASHIHTLRTV